GRLMVLLIALISIWIASDPESRVLGLVAYAWAGFGAAFGPVIILSVFWRRMNSAGALAGMVAGALVVVLWKQYSGSGLYEIVPGFIVGMIVIVAVSLMTQAPSQAVIDNFDRADRDFRNAV